MKAAEAKDLIVGRVYSVHKNIEASPIFKYKGPNNRRGHKFEHLGGPCPYIQNKMDGFYHFSEDGFPNIPLSPSEIEQYLPKTD